MTTTIAIKKQEPDFKLRLEYVGKNEQNVSGKSSKFWQAEVWGCHFVRRWGKIGTKGQTMRETFADGYQAKQAAMKMAGEKQRKGYTLEVDIITLIGSLAEAS